MIDCDDHHYHRIVGPVVRPLVLLVRAAHQRPLEVMHVGRAAVVEVPAARLTRAGAGGGSVMILRLFEREPELSPSFKSQLEVLWTLKSNPN